MDVILRFFRVVRLIVSGCYPIGWVPLLVDVHPKDGWTLVGRFVDKKVALLALSIFFYGGRRHP
jgi:hypothetical protein